MATELDLPDDLVAFLRAGRQLEYDPGTCEVGRVTLRALSDLRLELFPMDVQGSELDADDSHRGELGCYRVPGVDLVATSEDAEDERGLLVWFPTERRYGTWDSSHAWIAVFPAGVGWALITTAPARYIDSQWDGASVGAEPLVPWGHPYSAEQTYEVEPAPDA